MKNKLYETLNKGFDKLNAEHGEGDKPESALRGGNSGCFVAPGCIAGADPRAAILRYFGIQTKTDYDTQLMFDGGLLNEDAVVAQLKAAGVEVRCETEVPVKWDALGIAVTGRPDVMVGDLGVDGEFKAEYGIELKMLCSVWTVMKVAHFIVDSKPKTDHVIQAAHYSWQNNYLPWVLQYISRTNWAIPFYAQKASKKHPEGYFTEDHRCLRKNEQGVPFTFTPFTSLYDMTWSDDRLAIDDEETAVTGAGIREYYQYLTTCIKERTVPTIIPQYDYKGDSIPLDKNDAIKYYDFKEARHDEGFEIWLADCRAIAEETT